MYSSTLIKNFFSDLFIISGIGTYVIVIEEFILSLNIY